MAIMTSVMTSLVVLLLSYVIVKVASFWRRYQHLARAIDQLPGEKKHWLYGTLHTVGH